MPFKGRVSAIHAGSFFHLFNDDQQIELLKRCAKLLSEEKGSIIIGRQLGSKDPRNLRGEQGRDSSLKVYSIQAKPAWNPRFEGREYEAARMEKDPRKATICTNAV